LQQRKTANAMPVAIVKIRRTCGIILQFQCCEVNLCQLCCYEGNELRTAEIRKGPKVVLRGDRAKVLDD
jgi:hypothetical protein